MTNQQGAPEALANFDAAVADVLQCVGTAPCNSHEICTWFAASIRERLAALVEAQQPTTHVPNPAEIEHVAGDVSKNGPESNMAQQPAPSAAVASKAVLAAIRAANLQLVRTGDDEFMLVTFKQATPQADSQPAPVEVADAMADSQYLAGVSAGWNAANADDPNAALQKLQESRAGYLKPLRAARATADSVTAAAGGAAILKEILAAACCEDSETNLTGDQYRKLYDLQSRIQAMPTPPTQAADSVDLVGVRATGEHVYLGKIAMPPRMKAREIARSYFGHFEDEDGSDAELCFGALETLLDWLSKQGWEPNLKPIQGVHSAVSKTLVNQLLEALEISRVLKADYDSLENYGVASRKHAKAIADARAYVATPPAQAADSVTAPVRQGKWTWVPVEPSTAMLVAGNHGQPGDFSALKVWQDMLGALERSFDYTRPVDPPSTTPPAQALHAGSQQEARPCHVLTVRKAGALTEWEPTSMAFALPDGAHALYTLPQPTPPAQAADSQPAKVPTSATGGDWTQPTTVALRLGDAMQLLCGGKRPPDDMVQQWLDNTSESLQELAASNGPAWAQGIGLIDAAMVMVDQPTEIRTIDNPDRDHEHRAARAPADSGAAPAAFQRALDIRTAQGWKLGGDKVPVLYTDTINGKQVCRDDLWLCTTAAFATQPAKAADSVLEDAARLTYEQAHAIRQGHEIAASDGYFEARPQIDSNDRRKVFQAGFGRGWDAARKQGANHD